MIITNKDISFNEKNKIRYKTIRYLERYCDIEKRCQVCGKKAEIHHINYNDYLKVNLLCKEHHMALHKDKIQPPSVIDLEMISIKKPQKEKHTKFIGENIEIIKKEIFKGGKTINDMTKEYHTSPRVIKKFLTDLEGKKLSEKSKENAVNRKNLKKFQKNI